MRNEWIRFRGYRECHVRIGLVVCTGIIGLWSTKMRDLLRDLNPALRFMEEQRTLWELYQHPWKEVFDSLDLQQRLLSQSLPQAVKELDAQMTMPGIDLSAAMSEAVDSIKRMFSGVEIPRIDTTALEANLAEFRHAADEFSRVLEAMQPSALAVGAIVDHWKSATASFETLQEFHRTFGGELLVRLASIEESESEEEFRDSTALLLEHVGNQTGRLSPTAVARLGLWMTIVSILFTLYAFSVQLETSKLTDARLAEIEEQLVGIGERFAQHVDLPQSGINAEVIEVYVTERSANLWAEPSTAGTRLRKVSPKTLVVVFEARGRWLLVQIFDFVRMQMEQGWLYKRSLSQMDVEDIFDTRAIASVISRSPDIVSGAPVFKDTRVPVQALLDHLGAGDSIDEFLAAFPSVKRKQVDAFMKLVGGAGPKESDEDPAG